ncbi:hypothetical protein HW45_27240 [Vibrio sp. ER1A]|nr:hypothetical protein HW45_27240 [Vibrio sp. ER1A]
MHTEIEVFRIKKLITLPQLLIRVFIFQVAGYFITVKKNIGYPYIGHVDLNPVEPIWCNRFKSLSLLLFHSVACQQDIGKGEVDSLLSEGLAVFLGHAHQAQACFGLKFSLLDYLLQSKH